MTSRQVVLDGGSPWGFRMHGGADVNQPLRISRVNPGSKAAAKGVREGDLITSINDQPTRDITNAEAHTLLKTAGESLKLGLNQDPQYSPKRRNYSKTVLQEAHSETVKRSSFSTLTITSSSTNLDDEEKARDHTEATKTNGDNLETTHLNNRDNEAISQRSTLSSNCSTASTPSTLESKGANDAQPVDDPATMPDSKSKKRRNRRKAKKAALVGDNNEEVENDIQEAVSPTEEEEQLDFESAQTEQSVSSTKTRVTIQVQRLQCDDYRVESPKTVSSSSKTTTVVKSKSLDDEETLKITELSETSENEDKFSDHAIISEAESDVEFVEQAKESHHLSLDLQDVTTPIQSDISPEEEQHLRNFLHGLDLINSSEEASAKVQEVNETKQSNDYKTQRAKKREELAQYFLPVYQNPRYLDAISEEGSDLSDRECSKNKKPINKNAQKPPIKPKPTKLKTTQRQQTEEAILVDTKLVDISSTTAQVSKENIAQASTGVEIVFLEDSSASECDDDNIETETEGDRLATVSSTDSMFNIDDHSQEEGDLTPTNEQPIQPVFHLKIPDESQLVSECTELETDDHIYENIVVKETKNEQIKIDAKTTNIDNAEIKIDKIIKDNVSSTSSNVNNSTPSNENHQRVIKIEIKDAAPPVVIKTENKEESKEKIKTHSEKLINNSETSSNKENSIKFSKQENVTKLEEHLIPVDVEKINLKETETSNLANKTVNVPIKVENRENTAGVKSCNIETTKEFNVPIKIENDVNISDKKLVERKIAINIENGTKAENNADCKERTIPINMEVTAGNIKEHYIPVVKESESEMTFQQSCSRVMKVMGDSKTESCVIENTRQVVGDVPFKSQEKERIIPIDIPKTDDSVYENVTFNKKQEKQEKVIPIVIEKKEQNKNIYENISFGKKQQQEKVIPISLEKEKTQKETIIPVTVEKIGVKQEVGKEKIIKVEVEKSSNTNEKIIKIEKEENSKQKKEHVIPVTLEGLLNNKTEPKRNFPISGRTTQYNNVISEFKNTVKEEEAQNVKPREIFHRIEVMGNEPNETNNSVKRNIPVEVKENVVEQTSFTHEEFKESKFEETICQTSCELTPPPTPENYLEMSFDEEIDEFARHVSILLAHGNVYQLRFLVNDPRYKELSKTLRDKVEKKLQTTRDVNKQTTNIETKLINNNQERIVAINVESNGKVDKDESTGLKGLTRILKENSLEKDVTKKPNILKQKEDFLFGANVENQVKSSVKKDLSKTIAINKDKEEILLRDLQDATNYVNAVSPNSASRSPSAASDSGSSMATSQVTVQYNPMSSSSVGDISSILKDEEKFKEVKNPSLLKDICLHRLMALPFGKDILEELAEVSKGLQDVTKTENSVKPTPITEQRTNIAKKLPAFITKEMDRPNESFDVAAESKMSTNWVGVPTEDDPRILMCLSPTQKEQLEKTRKISKEADKLLELHEKFAQRRSYLDEIAETKHEYDMKSDVTVTNLSRVYPESSASKLLSIIRESSEERSDVPPVVPPRLNRKRLESSSSQPPEVPPRSYEQKSFDEYMHYEEQDPRFYKPTTPTFQRSVSQTLPRNLNSSQDRLKARDLSEWINLARDKSTSESNLSKMEQFPEFMRPAISAWHLTTEPDFQKNFMTKQFSLPYQEEFVNRRASLPHEFYHKQMEYILQKEQEIQDELDRLEAEKKRLTQKTINEDMEKLFESKKSKHLQQENNFSSTATTAKNTASKKPEVVDTRIFTEKIVSKPRPKSMPIAPSEYFRQQMYNEYMKQMAAREERKHNKVIKLSSAKHVDEGSELKKEVTYVSGIQDEFMDKVKQRMSKFGLNYDDSDRETSPMKKDDADDALDPVVVMEGSSFVPEPKLPKHLKEFVDITRQLSAEYENEHDDDGIWSPGQSTSTDSKYDEPHSSLDKDGDDQIPPVWTPKSAGPSPTPERKEFRPVSFESPQLSRKNKPKSDGSAESTPVEPPWKCPQGNTDVGAALASSLQNKLPTSFSAPASGFSDFQPPRLPRAQNPTITLLQKAREGQIPKGASYIEHYEQTYHTNNSAEKPSPISPGEIVYQIKSEYTSESESEKPRKMADLGPRKFEGIGPTTRDGMPLVLRSEVKDQNQSKWYKRMYDTIHKQKHPDDEYVMVRYKQRRGRYPYMSGYLSEPEPGAYDSDVNDRQFATLDRRRTAPRENEFTTSTMPRSTSARYGENVIKHTKDVYKNQPGRIENYVPGQSSISDKEAKEWWDEVMDIFDGHLEQQKLMPPTRSFMSQALKESGYESDSTLVFRRRDEAVQQMNPIEQKLAYKHIQKGGDVPLSGLRKPAPERPKEVDGESVPGDSFKSHPQEIFCYPITVIHDAESQVFGKAKKNAPCSNPIPTPPPMPPSPPRRKSSRNNTTLRMISNMKGRTEKSPTGKRHETCFIPSSEVDRTKVKLLREKISTKLSPVPKRKEEPKRIKPKSMSLVKPRINSNLYGSKSSILSKSSISSKSPDRRSTSASPTRKPCKPSLTKETITIKSRGVSLDRTFGAEKKKVDITLNKTRTKLIKSPEIQKLESKKVSLSQITSLPPGITYKKTSTLTGSRQSLLKSASAKAILQNKDAPVSLRSLKSASPAPSSISKTTSMSSLSSVKTNTKKVQKKSEVKTNNNKKAQPAKKKKDKVNAEIAKKDKNSEVLSEIKKQKEFMETDSFFQNLLLRDIPIEEIPVPVPVSHRANWVAEKTLFFQKDKMTKSEPSIRALKIYLNHTKPVSDSKFKSIDAALCRSRSVSPVVWDLDGRRIPRKIYFHKESQKERSISLPPKLSHSRSASPCLVNIQQRSKSRSTSPNKLIFSQTSRPISPKIERKRSPVKVKTESVVKKMYFSETSRPTSPILERRSRSPSPYAVKKVVESKKMYFSQTSRPTSPVVQRRTRTPSPSYVLKRIISQEKLNASKKKNEESKTQKMYFSETSRPTSPVIQRRTRTPSPSYVLKRIISQEKLNANSKQKKNEKMYFSQTSRPTSPVVQRRTRSPSPFNVLKKVISKENVKKSDGKVQKMYFSQTSRPTSPVVHRRIRSRTPSPNLTLSRILSQERINAHKDETKMSKMYFSETSRPTSPIVGRRTRTPSPYTLQRIRSEERIFGKKSSDSKTKMMYFSETSRPSSPVIERRSRSPSPNYMSRSFGEEKKLYFTQTSRPVSPVVERKTRNEQRCSSPSKLFFSETSRPVSPVIERKFPKSLPPPKNPPETKMFFSETSRPVSPVVERKIPPPPPLPKSLSDHKLYFSQTSRPMSPLTDRKQVSSPSPSYKLIKRTSEKSRHKTQRTKSVSEADRLKEESNLKHTFSTLSLDSIGKYENEFPSRRSSKFKELNQFYATLEKLGELERTTSSADLRPRRKFEEEIIDYDRWQEVRKRERAEKELKVIYRQLKEDQKEKGLLFLPKDVESYRWRKELDRGLRIKEKSVENIKHEFEKLKFLESDREVAKQREISWNKDNYKPLWRGSSVINLANSMVERRSQSEGRVPRKRLVDYETEKLLDRGIGSRIWSSLSMEQVNILKNQLAEIYQNGSSKLQASPQSDNSITVTSEKLRSFTPTLTVRRNSDASDQYKKPKSRVFERSPSPVKKNTIPPPPPFIQKSLSSPSVSPKTTLTETEKRKLSHSLSKEVMDVVSKRYQTCLSVIMGKETRGAIAAKEAKQSKNLNKEKVVKKNTKQEVPKQPLVKTDATVLKISPMSETESSTDGSTKTVIYAGNKDVLKKVEYFETAAERDVYTPTIYKPADSAGSDENDSELQEDPTQSKSKDTQKDDDQKSQKLTPSQSYQDLKELFGEHELVKFATLPLSATRKEVYSLPTKPQLRSVSPIKSTISEATSYESICRSRSLSPYMHESRDLVKTGDVGRLKSQFEELDFGEREDLTPRRSKSDSHLHRKAQINIPGLASGEVDNLRRKYEYPAFSGRGRSRYRRAGVVSPIFLRAEDRFMPHINIISKIASLRRASSPTKEKSRSNEELAEILGIPIGEVVKLREKFDSPDRSMSLLGQMFTSSPNMQELRDIAPYLTGNWAAHKYPRCEDNTRSLSSPEHSFPSRDTNLVRRDRHRPKSTSPPRSKSKLSSILKTQLRAQSPVELVKKKNSKDEPLRYRSWWSSIPHRPTVTFKEPEGPPPPPKGPRHAKELLDPESPRKYVENEVTIHYRTPVRHEIKEALSEEELARRQAEAMKKIYQEERRRKYLQELQDMNSRRHTDNFIPSQKSPIPLNRYDDFVDDLSPKLKPRPKSPEPRLVARALYNFVGQSARELTFRKGDVIFVRRQVDKNWFEGEFNAMVGLFPANYVEIVPYDGVKTTPRKAHEGQARAKYNFIAQTHLELSLAKGELVVITRRVDDNWYEGKIGGRKGIFPVSYVEVLIDPSDPPPAIPNTKPVASPAAHSLLLNGSSGGKDSMGSHSYTPSYPNPNVTTSYHAKPVQLTGAGTYASLNRRHPMHQTLHIDTENEPIPYRALYKYKPQNDDELELMEGDTVFVLEKCDDGWYVGSSDRTGAFGTFPGNYVEKI